MSSEIAATQTAAPDVSVIVPVHNVAPWLVDCLTSILDQEVDHEVIVVDDASTDDTWSIVGEFARRDPRVRAVRNIGKGGAQARNYGVELARGEYIAFADGDDIVPRRAYKAMLDAAREDAADMVVGGFLKFYTTRTWHPTESWGAWAQRRSATTLDEQPSLIRNRACWNRLFRRDFWVGENILFPTVPRSNDVVPMTKALVAARRITVLPETVYLYRNRPGSTSMSSRASGLVSFESYLRQELASCIHVSSLGSAGLMDEYDELVIVRDGWVHLRNFLRDLAAGGRMDDPSLTAPLAEISSVIGELLSRLTDRMDRRADSRTRWIWALARAGRWAEAVRLVTDPVAVVVTEDPLVFPSLTGGEATLVDEKDHRRVLSSLLVEITDPETPTSADTVERLAKHAGLFSRLYPANALHWHSAAVQHLVLVAQTGNADMVRTVLDGKPLKVSEVQLTVQGRQAALSATVSPVGQVSGITVQTAQGASRQSFARTVVDEHTGQVEAVTAVGSLPVGRTFVRVRMHHEVGTIDVVVSPTIAHDDRSRRVFRSETNRQVHIDPGFAKRVLEGPRKGARAAKRFLHRVVRS